LETPDGTTYPDKQAFIDAVREQTGSAPEIPDDIEFRVNDGVLEYRGTNCG
jgi:hypothetical protein